MNLDKSQKRISKKASKGFQGYPLITITYYGPTDKLATRVDIGFVAEENSEPQIQSFNTSTEIREDITVQTTIVKIMDRSEAVSVTLTDGVLPLS